MRRRFAPRSFASLEDDARGHGEGFLRLVCVGNGPSRTPVPTEVTLASKGTPNGRQYGGGALVYVGRRGYAFSMNEPKTF